MFPRVIVAILVGLVCEATLFYNAVSWRQGLVLDDLRPGRRFWEELSIATSNYLEFQEPTSYPSKEVGSWPGTYFTRRLHDFVLRLVKRRGIHPWQFWQVFPRDPPFKREPIVHRSIEDTGRSTLVRLGFILLGGIAPFLPIWIGLLIGSIALLWLIFELCLANRPVAAIGIGLSCASSVFMVELLTLHYSAAGFYLVGLWALAAFGTHCVMGNPAIFRGFLIRAHVVGWFLAICALCRSGVLLFLPAVTILVLAAVLRRSISHPRPAWLFPQSTPRIRFSMFAAGMILVITPYLAVRPSKHHDVWVALWEGLGDFDRSKGHVCSDGAAIRALSEAGYEVPSGQWAFNAAGAYSRYAAFFREQVVHHIKDDPIWYAAILIKRLAATASQWKLAPHHQFSGRSFAKTISMNEGRMDVYYSFTATADWIGLARYRFELPLLVLWTPLILLIVVEVCFPRPGSSGYWLLLFPVTLASLSVPVLITVAGAFETQCFVFVYFLGLAFLLHTLFDRLTGYRRLTQHRQSDPPIR